MSNQAVKAGSPAEFATEQVERAGSTGSTTTMPARLLLAGLFWALCLMLSAAGHRLYKSTVVMDRAVSVNTYRIDGPPLVWVGYGDVEDSYERIAGTAADNNLELSVLPNSPFWMTACLLFTALGAVLVWSGRWIANTGIQSLVGLFAGHFLWLGAVEFGLDAAGRQLGLAASLEVVGDRVVGTHAAGVLIQLSAVFLVPMLIGLTFHESNRCAVFQWFRKRLPIARTPAHSGRVENYAARTATQFFMTVWFCYVGVLWLADPAAGRFGEIGLLLIMLGIIVAVPYMIWRTARQPNLARALRYSVSGAVVAWTAIEIAASMRLFREPWLSTSLSSGLFFLGMSVLLAGLALRFLIPGSAGSMARPTTVASIIALIAITVVGCHGPSLPNALTNDEIDRKLREYEEKIGPSQAAPVDGLLHAMVSGDPEMRAQAAVAVGKSGHVPPAVKARLEVMASSDESRLSQLAALEALDRLNLISPELEELRRELRRK